MQKLPSNLKLEDLKFQKSPRNYFPPPAIISELDFRGNLDFSTTSTRQPQLKYLETPHFFKTNQSKSVSQFKNRLDFPKHLSPSPPSPSDFNSISMKNRLNYVKSPDPVTMKVTLLPKLEKSYLQVKKTVVVDLDETLIHASPTNKKPDHIITKILPDGSTLSLKVSIRPFAKDFIRTAAGLADVVIFTASVKNYADPIIDLLDPCREFVKLRLYRESCILTSHGFVKDLSILKKNLKDIIIVDNLASSFAKQKENGILISSWFGDGNDNELLKLSKNIRRILSYEDLRRGDKNFQIIY
jgi:CTD small phosphatase-like protein 2